MYWIALFALVVATGFDLREREIPDTISVVLLATALIAKALGFHPVPWGGIALGAGLAFLLSATAFALGALGGGDVKLLTALGATLGVSAMLPFALATGIIGGVAALFLRGRKDLEMAYAPVMLAGLVSLLPVLWLAG